MTLDVSIYRKSKKHTQDALDGSCLLCMNELYSVLRLDTADQTKFELIPQVLAAAGHPLLTTKTAMDYLWVHRPECNFVQVCQLGAVIELQEPMADPIVIELVLSTELLD